MGKEEIQIKVYIDEDFGEFKLHFIEPENFFVPLPFSDADEAKAWANAKLKPALEEVMTNKPDIPFEDQVKEAIGKLIKP